MKQYFKYTCAFLSILMLLTFEATAHAAGDAKLKLSANRSRLKVGQELTMEVLVKNAPPIYGADVHLSFDPRMLEVVDADANQVGIQLTPGDFIDPAKSFSLQHQVNNDSGTIDYALTLLNPALPAQGNGRLVRVTFRTKTVGRTTISIENGLFGNQIGETITPALDSIEIRINPSNTGPIQDILDGHTTTGETTAADSSLEGSPLPIPWPVVGGTVGVGLIVAAGGWFWLRHLPRK